ALAQEVIAESVGTELADDLHWLDGVPERLADLLDGPRFLVLHVDEAVAEDLLRRLHLRGPEHRGPESGMEPRDVLADEMHIRGPVLLEGRFIVAVADAGDVSQQRIEPDVDRE